MEITTNCIIVSVILAISIILNLIQFFSKKEEVEEVEDTIDKDTGLYNKNILKEIKTSDKEYHTIFCEVDGLERIKNGFGKPASEIVVNFIGNFLNSSFKKNLDFVINYNDNEFLILFNKENSTTGDLFNKLESLKTKLEDKTIFVSKKRTLKATMSFGVVHNTEENKEQTLEERIDSSRNLLIKNRPHGINLINILD